ncbi:MAG: ATP-binding protein [Bacteroidales bacterium]|jgi:signal transduction histidine kinase|nr:ATP-binding protein [Bacteroidales bacterium]
MGYKHVTLSALVNIAIILIAVFAAGFLSAYHMDARYLMFLLPVPISAYSIINSFNQSNRQIAFFFEAIRNDDSSLKFPTQIRQKSLRHLYHSLTALNEQINQIKLQNEYLEKYFRTFIQHASTGLMSVNQDNEVEIMNDKAFEYAGIPSYTPLHLVPLRTPDLLGVLAMIKPGEAFTYKRLTGDTQINLLIRSKEIRYGGKVSKLISLQDIRHELDEKELDSWQKLIRVLTHEIMNSIAPIVSLTGTLKNFFLEEGQPVKPGKVDEETIDNVIQGLDTIEDRGNGLVNFVDSYRKLTRIPKPEFISFPVKEWLEQIWMLLQEKLEKLKIQHELKIEPRVTNLTGDKKMLTQVVINIMNNAMEALEEIQENRKIKVTVSFSSQSRSIIRISNNGPSIPEEIIEKIFIPFFTTKDKGSGIGLSLSRQILRLHSGGIHVESAGDTTSFIITL